MHSVIKICLHVACFSNVISFDVVFTIQPCLNYNLKCIAAYTGREFKLFYTLYTDINGVHVI